MQEEVVVRVTTAQDADQVVELIYSSAPEMFDYMFKAHGKTAQDFIRYEFQQGGGFIGHRIHKVAVHGDTIKGIGAFYTGAQHGLLNIQTAWHVLKFYGLWSGVKTLIRASHSGSVMLKPKKSEIYIADLGVAEHSRSQGIGSVLIDYHKAEAKQRGMSHLALDVATINPRAEALYARLGFEVTGELMFKGGSGAENVPGARRMIYSVE